MEDPERRCTASVYVAVVHCWEQVERDFLSVLSIYPKIFLSVFIVYRLFLLGITYCVSYSKFMCIVVLI